MSSFDMVEWVDANLDKAKPSAKGEWTATCPECGKFGGFYVNTDPEHERAGNFVCFKCDFRGKSFTALVAKVEDIEYSEARRLVLKESVAFRRKETAETLKDRIKALRNAEELDWDSAWGEPIEGKLPTEFIPVWDGKRWRVPEYMTERGFYRETLRDWSVGYCERGWYGGRVIIPFDCPNGKSFTARDMTDEQEPKYLNPKGVDHGRLLYGWPHAPLTGDFVLVEGPLDAMKLCQHGIPAIGTGGKVLRTEQLNMLFKRPAHIRVTVMYDPEEHTAPFGAAEQLITRFRNLSIARLPLGTDPGDCTRRQALRAIDRAKPYDGNRTGRVLGAISATRERLNKKFA